MMLTVGEMVGPQSVLGRHSFLLFLLVIAALAVCGPPGAQELTTVAQAASSPSLHEIILLPDADTYVDEQDPQRNWGNAPEMRVGYEGEGDDLGRIRALLHFDISSLQIVTIHTATLRLCLVTSWDVPEVTHIYTVHRASGDWSETEVTWENAPPAEERYGSASVRHEEWGWYAFDVTRLAQTWQQGTFENDGMVIVGPETIPNLRGFCTREGPYPPQLVILYEGEAPSPTPTASFTPTTTPTPSPTATMPPTPTPRPRYEIALPLLLVP